MADLVFYINNIEVPPPDNYQGVDIEVDFTNDTNDASIKTGTYEWLGTNAGIMNAWRTQGLFGGPGIFEGPSFRIEACKNPSVVVFDGCIDMTTRETTFTCDIVKASVKETNKIQHILDRASSFSFAYLKSLNLITTADYIPVPYVLSNIPDYVQVGILIVTFIEMIKLIYDSIQTTVGYIQSAASAYPIVWQMAMYSALATISVIYSIFLTVLLVNTLLMLINELIQPVKFKYGMRVLTMFQKACSYMGIGFSSTILQNTVYKNLVIIPKKSAYYHSVKTPDQFIQNIFHSTAQRKVYDETYNPLAYGYYDGTFHKLIEDMETYFNAKAVMKNNVLHFERWDFWNNAAIFTMPNQSSEAPFQDPFGTNASDITANYLVEYLQDTADENTYDQYDGTSSYMTLKPLVINNPKNQLLKGLTTKTLPFALAKRKESLTVVEHVVNKIIDGLTHNSVPGSPSVNLGGTIYPVFGASPWGMLTFWDNFFSVHAVPPLPPNQTNNRVGAMLLSQDFTSEPKILVINDKAILWKRFDGTYVNGYSIDPNNNRTSDHMGYTDANFLTRCYHSASWAVNTQASSNPSTSTTLNVPATTYPNQYLTYEDKEIPLCCKDFNNLKDNNIIKSYDMKPGRVDSLRWNPFLEVARVDFRVKEVYTKNLGQKIVIDGNQ